LLECWTQLKFQQALQSGDENSKVGGENKEWKLVQKTQYRNAIW
jgi:hypothetical protein